MTVGNNQEREYMLVLNVSCAHQTLSLFEDKHLLKQYPVSTALKGVGEQKNSEQTPRGWHVIRAKIGADCKVNTVFVGRRPTGEYYSPELKARHPTRDWILTRIFWLSGTEVGKNRLGSCDTMQRYIYIHGTPDEVEIGVPGSHGCIRMYNNDIIELFDIVPVGTRLLIQEE